MLPIDSDSDLNSESEIELGSEARGGFRSGVDLGGAPSGFGFGLGLRGIFSVDNIQ